MDKLTKEQRHRCMSAIKGRNTKPELLVRKFLFSRGFRYRLNHPRLPGHPDLVLRKYRTVIFVTAVSGTDMRDVSIMFFQRQMLRSGGIKLNVIGTGIWKTDRNWLLWVGIVSPFGSVS